MAKGAKTVDGAAARKAHYEFCGPLGVSVLTATLPLTVYLAVFVCNDISGCPAPSLLRPATLTIDALKREVAWPGIAGLVNADAVFWTLAYYALSILLQVVLPGQAAYGTELATGGKLQYKFNSFSSAIVIIGGAAVGTALQGVDFPLWPFIWDNYVQIITVNVIISFALATWVYLRSFSVKKGNQEKRELAAGGRTGNIIYDWFIGRELNPRIDLPLIGTIDIKIFCELRPGMLGWVLLNLAFIARQFKLYGIASDSIILITAFQALYVFDALYMEAAVLTTMDITTDGFGFMLAFGDLVWLPFIYSLQARYLAIYPVYLGYQGIGGILAVQGLGYYIFRSANNQKNRFRTNPSDPKVSHLEFIQTRAGSKLLTSGWWGTARHINYLGDFIMAWSYCLPTAVAGYVVARGSPHDVTGKVPVNGYTFAGAPAGTQVVQGEARGWGMLITYFYIVYFAILLIHRERRDDEKCAKKYGEDWVAYKKKVPYRIVPYLY